MSHSDLITDQQAHYVFADVYRYHEEAIDAIKTRFSAVLRQLPRVVHQPLLLYSNKGHAFHLRCATEDGQILERMLETVLEAYRREEKHNLQRFEQSVLASADEDVSSVEDEQQVTDVPAVKMDNKDKVSYDAIVLDRPYKDTTGIKVQAQLLSELDHGTRSHYKKVLERSQPVLSSEVRLLKAYKLDTEFNVWERAPLNIAAAMAPPDQRVCTIFRTPLHTLLSDMTIQDEEDGGKTHNNDAWTHANKAPSVEQWLAGMGDNELMPPDTAAEKPDLDTAKAVVFRTRLPLATPAAASSTAKLHRAVHAGADSESTGSAPSVGSVDLDDLLPPRAKTNEAVNNAVPSNITAGRPITLPKQHISAQTTVESSHDSDDERPSDSEYNVKPLTNRDTRGSAFNTPSPASSAFGTQQSTAKRSWKYYTNSASKEVQQKPPHQQSNSTKRAYSKVNHHGLVGCAEEWVRWETETGQSAASRSRVSSRASSSSPKHILRRDPVSLSRAVVNKETHAPWATKIVRNAPVHPTTLIDTNLSSSEMWPKLAEQPHKTSIDQVFAGQSGTANHQRESSTVPETTAEEDLIAFSDTTEFFSVRSLSPDPDSTPIEKLMPVTAPQVRHHTMRQQTKNKKKKQQMQMQKQMQNPKQEQWQSKKSNQASGTAEVNAKPDSKQQLQQQALQSSAALTVVSDGLNPALPPIQLSHRMHAGFSTILSGFFGRASESFKLHIQFGTCLLQALTTEPDVVQLQDRMMKPCEMQKRLVQSADVLLFIPAELSLSEAAALYSEISSAFGYEPRLQDLDSQIKIRARLERPGEVLTVEFDIGNHHLDAGTILSQTTSTSIVCPQDLWDCRLSKFSEVDDPVLRDFVQGFQLYQNGGDFQKLQVSATIPTVDGTPAFKVLALTLIKAFSKFLRVKPDDYGDHRATYSEWITAREIPIALHRIDPEYKQLKGTVVAEEQLDIDGRNLWRTYVSFAVDTDATQYEDRCSASGGMMNSICGIMNKMYLGKNREVAMGLQSRKKQREAILW